MIIWLNGTFGAGKTSTAERLVALVPGSRVFDPETVGYMLTANLSDRPVADFQDWPAWRPLVAATLIELSRMTGQHLIAPQSVMKQEYFDEIFGLLRADGVEVFHVVLDAADAVLRSRIEGSDEAREWRLDHLDQYREARPWMTKAADFVVDTAASTPPQIARRILNAVPGLPKQPAPKAAAPEAPQEATPGKLAQAPAAPDKAVPEKAVSEKASPEKAATQAVAAEQGSGVAASAAT